MGAQLISGAQGDQMSEGSNGSQGSPINREPMEPIELWSPVTSGAQQPWKPRDPSTLGSLPGCEIRKGILIRWMR